MSNPPLSPLLGLSILSILDYHPGLDLKCVSEGTPFRFLGGNNLDERQGDINGKVRTMISELGHLELWRKYFGLLTSGEAHDIENAVQLIVMIRVTGLDVLLPTVEYGLGCQQLGEDAAYRPNVCKTNMWSSENFH